MYIATASTRTGSLYLNTRHREFNYDINAYTNNIMFNFG